MAAKAASDANYPEQNLNTRWDMSKFAEAGDPSGAPEGGYAEPRTLVRRNALRQTFKSVRRPSSARETAVQSGRVSVCKLEDIIATDAWRNSFSDQCKDSRYYEIVEQTLHPEFGYRNFVLRDDEGKIRAVQPFLYLDQDMITGTNGLGKTIVDSIRKVWPKFLYAKTLMVGCAAGEGHLSQKIAFQGGQAARLVAEAALKEARANRAALILFKEFPSEYREILEPLKDFGYIRLPSLPMASLSLDYKSFDDYLSKALSAATRKNLRRKFKAADAANLQMSIVTDPTPYVDELLPLYEQVYNRSPLHFEKLTKEYLCNLGRRMPDKTKFFIWRMDRKIVAFNLCMVHGDTIYDQYIGLDYSVALDLHLYHSTFRDVATWAIANGYKRYLSNSLNYDPKLHLRMLIAPIDLYVRHRSNFVNAFMKVFLPLLEPTQHDPALKKFANYQALWS